MNTNIHRKGSILKRVENDRKFFQTLGNIYPISQSVSITESDMAGVKIYWMVPEKRGNTIIVYFHGGNYALGGIESHKGMVSYIAEKTASTVAFVEYSLAPEYPFPIARNEGVNVYQQLLVQHPESDFIFMGDSAGGGLVVSSLHAILARNIKLPKAVLLISPWINLKCNTESYKTRQDLDLIKRQDLLDYAAFYIGKKEEFDPSELKFDIFPPTFILVGNNEILLDDAKNFYEYISAIQKNTKIKVYKNQTHVWLLTDINSHKSKEALVDIATFIQGGF